MFKTNQSSTLLDICRQTLGILIFSLGVVVLIMPFSPIGLALLDLGESDYLIVELLTLTSYAFLCMNCYGRGLWLIFVISPKAFACTFRNSSNPDKERLVLYLRPFSEDTNNSTEQIVCATFSKTANIVTIGRPKDRILRPTGAQRVFTENWKKDITRLIDQADHVIMKFEIRPSLLWELAVINNSNQLDKLTIIKDHGSLPYDRHAIDLPSPLRSLPKALPNVCLISFEEDTPVVIDSGVYSRKSQYKIRDLLETQFYGRRFRQRSLRDSPMRP